MLDTWYMLIIIFIIMIILSFYLIVSYLVVSNLVVILWLIMWSNVAQSQYVVSIKFNCL